jgi:hypothetical protein
MSPDPPLQVMQAGERPGLPLALHIPRRRRPLCERSAIPQPHPQEFGIKHSRLRRTGKRSETRLAQGCGAKPDGEAGCVTHSPSVYRVGHFSSLRPVESGPHPGYTKQAVQ